MQCGVAVIRVSHEQDKWGVTDETNVSLARFPSHECWLRVDGNPYQDLVRQLAAELRLSRTTYQLLGKRLPALQQPPSRLLGGRLAGARK